MDLYGKNRLPFDESEFINPGSEYRGAPFWAWNCNMTVEKIHFIIDNLKAMGMGGAHIHCRTGLENPYMSEEFLDLVKRANEKLRKEHMLTWLYDEDRWPSGAGGGLVTRNKTNRMRFLVFSPYRNDGTKAGQKVSPSSQAVRSNDYKLLARYEILLVNGYLSDYRMLTQDSKIRNGYTEWFAYIEISGDNPWFNNQAYVNTLDKKAIRCFLDITHERYKAKIFQEFGQSIPAIFTDEPQFSHKTRLSYAEAKEEVILPYTDDFEETFTAAYGHGLLPFLPEVLWEKENREVSQIRYEYHDHTCERFVTAFADTIGEWCEANNIMLTGHVMDEDSLKSQTAALGETMRSYRAFQLPGIDMLCDRRNLLTAKQAQSVVHQFMLPGVLSEMYGVTNWDFDFRGHKLQGDWQAALGVTVRVHHLTWTSMGGEAKRDYPASIGYQSPWFKEYKYIEDYFARINTLLTRGRPVVKVGVIHPIESYWLYWGCEEQTGDIRDEMERNFQELVNWMLYSLIDFDLISESLLQHQCEVDEITAEEFPVGEMKYQVIVVANCMTLRSSTYKRLKRFREKGGCILFTGVTPKLTDGKYSKEIEQFATSCEKVPFVKYQILNRLNQYRVIDIKKTDGTRADNLIYQMRSEDKSRILFISHVNKMKNPDIPSCCNYTVLIKGIYKVICYNPLDGTKEELGADYKNGKTIITRKMYDHDSLLLRLLQPEDTEYSLTVQKEEMPVYKKIAIDDKVQVELTEPNVFVLDQAMYRFDNSPWQKKEEILRIDNKFRKLLGYPLRGEAYAQPWICHKQEMPDHCLMLKYTFSSMVDISDVKLAMENRNAEIWMNGRRIDSTVHGWYADRDIICRLLGMVNQGVNELIVKIPYSRGVNVENMFLLGDFGVQVSGREAVLVPAVKRLAYSDITRQNLPFYGGNIIYNIPFYTDKEEDVIVEASRFRAPLLKVQIDNQEAQILAFSPYRVKCHMAAGKHILKLTVFGSRINTFGTLHNCNDTEEWYGPDAWRTEKAEWSYEYQLKPAGLLKAPVMYSIDRK